MTEINPFKLLGIGDSLLIPIQKIIERILPDFIEEELRDDKVRQKIVVAVDLALTTEYQAAKAVPQEVRYRIIRRLLDLFLDEILLPGE